MDKKLFIQQLKEARADLIKEIKREILGPGSEFSLPDADHEIITDMPETRYSTGILFPQDIQYNAENDDSMKVESNSEITEDDLEESSDKENVPDEENKGTDHYVTSAEEESLDEDISLTSQNLPSSMGFTFFLKGDADVLIIDVSFGMYRKTVLDDCMIPFIPDREDFDLPFEAAQYLNFDKTKSLLIPKMLFNRSDVMRIYEKGALEDPDLKDRMFLLTSQMGRNGFKRIPFSVRITLDFKTGNLQETLISESPVKITVLRRKMPGGFHSFTVMMVNTNKGRYNGKNSVFQPKMTVKAGTNDNYAFTEYNITTSLENNEEEEKSLKLLYRNKKVYGTGHGTSVNWEIDENGKGYIETEFFPSVEVPQIDFEPDEKWGISESGLSMKNLSDLNNVLFSEKIKSMRTLTDAYKNWIFGLQNQIKNDSRMTEEYKKKAEDHIKSCVISSERMEKGLALLSDEANERIRIAFMLANRAMFMQRIHLKFQENDKYPDDSAFQNEMRRLNYFDCKDEYFWRPFQLAFLLMSLESITDEHCKDRDLVDLIWFPTGGGKTEAYLGLSAFTIFYRRLQYPSQTGGTAVIMRYTLRLLTAQQFTRAATLICACEYIRNAAKRKKSPYPVYDLGEERITIGLWIGGDHTPNGNTTGKYPANESLEKLTEPKGDLRFRKERYNKFQILKCPWCGTKLVKDHDPDTKKEIGEWGYKMKNKTAFYLCCTQEGCSFETSLPIQVVDEELYKNPPTLLFGTVDKFAMLPWKKETGAFFAVNSDNKAPELIIQDELHLISGPLGTIVGLYEAAVDALCSAKGIRPKIIASTATIRRAREQCSVLFNREVSQFPSPGINAEDSFFAREADFSKRNGRFYIGLMPSGKTKAMTEVRAIAALLERTDMLNYPDEVKDKFWTLTVYFNSMKDLGKCSSLIDDDVKDFIKRTAYRFGLGRGRLIVSSDELTSRVTTSQLNETLEKLERIEYSRENIKKQSYAVNTLLATNMISVGIDIGRLNVMLIVGQPKLTSEYIQASSRIGRNYPGAAFILYDATKSRDRSHYEQFKAYHESFYKYVEPTGATPFSEPARERALHAVIVSLMRLKYGLSDEIGAGNFDQLYYKKEIKEIEEYILDRFKSVKARSGLNIDYDEAELRTEINDFFNTWQHRAETAKNSKLKYGESFMTRLPSAEEKRLLKVFGSGGNDPARETLTSMRNVETNSAGNILVWDDDK